MGKAIALSRRLTAWDIVAICSIPPAFSWVMILLSRTLSVQQEIMVILCLEVIGVLLVGIAFSHGGLERTHPNKLLLLVGGMGVLLVWSFLLFPAIFRLIV